MAFESICSTKEEEEDCCQKTLEIPNNQLLLIYQLELNGFNETRLFRCEKFNRLRFQIGPSLYGRRISLKTNYTDDYTQFNRNEYKQIDIRENLQFKSSGSFHFIYTENNVVNDDDDTILGSFYIVVSPEILIPNRSKQSIHLSINALQCQTILSKLMGPIDQWKQRLNVSIQCHYNMIHWTPIQILGKSNSAYSLADQLRLNQTFRTENMIETGQDCTIDNVSDCIEWLRKEHGVISIIDIVLNHTANESPWLRQYPDSAFNCKNSPWLRPAFLLDRMLYNVTLDIEQDRWIDRGIHSNINSVDQLESIGNLIREHYLPLIKLEEFYLCDPLVLVEKFEKFLRQQFNDLDHQTDRMPAQQNFNDIILEQDPQFHRLNCTVDMENAFKFIKNQIDYQPTRESIENWLNDALSCFQQQLIQLNNRKRQEIISHIDTAIENVLKGARYERFDSNGPKIKKLTRTNPLTTEYFTDNDNDFVGEKFIENESKLYDDSKCCYYMAHNGWVMGDDPLRNFADKDSLVYLRRELICWGDSVKLRYGQQCEDSPFLWSHMEQYVTQMAKVFQGLRLDNCHSTPIHVAQYMIDVARRVNPDLYLIAELFTSSEDLDNLFVNKLGINSLIREAMSANTPHELQRQVYRFGGQPVGSFKPDLIKTGNSTKEILYSRPMIPSITHAIFFDQTHDNESPIVKRTVLDPLPSSALIAMTYSAIGSNRGYDELVPHHIHVVNEQRLYRCWNDNDDPNGDGNVNLSKGILYAKRILNNLHFILNSGGYSEAFVDQRDRDTIVITRHNPSNHQSIVLEFPPSSVIAFSFTLLNRQQNALNQIQKHIIQFDLIDSQISMIVQKLNLIDLNYILFRCQQEEFDENSSGTYQLSNGSLVYSGLAGIMFHLAKIRTNNDLGHPLCENLRQGNWLPEYIVGRLKKRSETKDLAEWLEETFKSLVELPRYLIPHFIRNGDEFIQRLTLGSVALIGFHPSSSLPPLHQSISSKRLLTTMAAGLPHFSIGYMRNWGRDTFISLKGLLLLTGRFEEAKIIILAYGGCLRHGLIPNLLDSGKNPRYNCRDAIWWWLQAIKQYIQLVPNGHLILDENVYRIFPTKDDSIEPLHCTMQEALNQHFNGIDFVEKNAGKKIDAHMTEKGFHIQIGVDRSTGFVYGGNQWNCGTWMDKMGSSDKAGNRGRPATPRDGSAIEIVALSQSIIEFLAELKRNNQYPYEGVHCQTERWTFEYWNEKIQENFEKYFYIGDDCNDQYINRRNIYKDTVGSTIQWMDYQLRPNFLIAMVVAPKMFNELNAQKALDIVSKTLVGPLGLKTLDPSDWTYRGDYDNSNDSNDPSIAHGFNYHNGPEWLWPMGYYLMAQLQFNNNNNKTSSLIKEILSKHFKHLYQSEWFGLPELTNSNGQNCPDSCPIQSWSHSTLIETLYMIFCLFVQNETNKCDM
ncbi:hypothetical protein DERP_011461 [Dermatophagoides pteronyssinus]|uniref:4-alpha-glucanotransferase n=1 Tax=Dermatophagoides pteronyssinus TaxID=6956 RepID=A0ABQ8J5W2_DERPT|nr:hypothetical protein DERP_011461 [Dermatophagoides pteronyssinus]